MDLTTATKLEKLKYYYKKYGLLHTFFAGVGRYSNLIWKITGPIVSSKFSRNYINTHKFRLLNLGSGSNCIKTMLNVDIDPRADVYVDITRPLPFDDNIFDRIFAEETIEHINFISAQFLLSECFRIMRKNGVIRITTPSLEYFCSKSLEEDIYGNDINWIFYNHGHRHIYTCSALNRHLKNAGFTNISFSTYKDPDSELGEFDSHADRFSHPPEYSHYVEARKK